MLLRFKRGSLFLILAGRLVACWSGPTPLSPPGPALPGTNPLLLSGDIASNLVAGVDRFLDRKLTASREARSNDWHRDTSSLAAYIASAAPQRARLAQILGAVEPRPPSPVLELIETTVQPSLVATSSLLRVRAVRWPAFAEVTGEGLLIEPLNIPAVADAIVLPDADLTPEQLLGLDPGVPPASQFPSRLAEAGARVLVISLINRNKGEPKVAWDQDRGRRLTNREYLHRAAFEMGRTLAGYEVLKAMAAIDALNSGRAATSESARPIGIAGWGEGGRLALYAAALDPRFHVALVSGYFGPREEVWREPLDRNVFDLLTRFGDAEIASLISPRAIVIEAARGPEMEFPSDGGAPGHLTTPALPGVRREVDRLRDGLGGLVSLVESGDGEGPFGSAPALHAFLKGLGINTPLRDEAAAFTDLRSSTDPRPRAERQRRELDRHTQQLLLNSPYARQAFMRDLDTRSIEKFTASQEKYRAFFAEQVIGQFPDPPLPFNPRSRQAYDDPKWVGYEVVLDVYPDVIAYGLLLVPKDLPQGERRPVVVCQHGLEGRPQSTIGKEGHEAYAAFSAQLAERGYVIFAPQNLYIFRDRFRVLQRKANPLGKTLFSIITPQHRQIIDWLKTLPFVDPDRIAFYGLSYGGKTAMRVPALLTDYCLSICSADFNEWVWKNASTRSPYSYVWTGEYEIFEWDLGHTFNYAEMAALIAPRPFMVERGHFDGVAPDETVACEFAKVRHLYAAKLRLPPETCQIEWFVGPHTIHGRGTFEFLQRHLAWPP
jgi:dienelactone hydrolase